MLNHSCVLKISIGYILSMLDYSKLTQMFIWLSDDNKGYK